MTKRILVDMDGILADLLKTWLSIYNKEFGKNLTKADVSAWGFQNIIPKEHQEAFDAIVERHGIFRNLDVLDGAKEGMAQLHDMCMDCDAELFICTSATCSPHAPMEKILWLEEHFPYIDSKHFISCYAKHMVKATVLIDDSSINARKYRKEWPEALIYGIAYEHNTDFDKYGFRIDSYKNTSNAWREIVDDIEWRLFTAPKMMLA